MFPFPHDHQSEYLGFEVSSTPQQEDFMQQDLIMMPDSHEVLPSNDLQGCRLSDININEANVNKDTDAHERKIMRRDNERQRRQLMAIRTASLRSLLPLESIKGKRSLSEHINEAVNYIKQLKEKTQELNAKREELRRVHQHYSSSAHDFSPEITGNLGTKSTSNIMVGPTCWGGVEIVVSTSSSSTNSSELEGFALSGVLKALLAEGLTIVECASTTVNQRLFHTIQCEVEDLARQNLPELQQKLSYLCNSG